MHNVFRCTSLHIKSSFKLINHLFLKAFIDLINGMVKRQISKRFGSIKRPGDWCDVT